MLFKVESRGNGRSTHCGVLEFSADEGLVYMPYWVSPACNLTAPNHPLHVCFKPSLFSIRIRTASKETG